MTRYLIVGLLIVCALVWYDYSQVHPGRTAAILAQTQANQQLQADLETARRVQDQVISLKKDLAETARQMKELAARLPRRSEAGTLLEQLTTTKGPGMRFEAVTPKPPARKTVNVELSNPPVKGTVTYEEQEVHLEILTTFRHIGRYLATLEQLPNLIEVTGLRLSTPAPGKPLGVTLIVKIFVYGG
ncbi:MAG: hypothetical protein OZSIB_3586 [Candidatus Ozemobacter sibiricus]|jgi:Tfp pilus assembly protein PilO|uniref:Type IV pilus biogenesis protein PilO n=1 Tax=Candidatus Ozemobacter sibiricus TaxID=2268124 RepID=A0A367ZRS3_9BACT|nr:MAG: hypothetical protein OZSIB_3586 [Candidatus Ozemobacter sibiricus]